MAQHSDNALRIACFLEAHPRVTKLLYPGLDSFPQFELARKQQTAGGALIAFEVEGGVDAGIRLMNSVRLCALAENLGSAETLITHPASMTHADVPASQRQAAGITDGLVRLSVGLEDPVDIIRDLSQALAQTKGAGDANENRIIVLKFGSSVLRNEIDLPAAVHEIYRWWRDGFQVVAVVSAFGNTTDELTQRALSVCDQPDDALVAALLATGEATSSVLLGLALNRSGIPATVLDAEQAGLSYRWTNTRCTT